MLPLLRRMHPELKLTGFLDSFHGEQSLVLQIQWKDVVFRPVENIGPNMVPAVDPVSLYSSLQRIPYDSLSRLPPSELDISRSLSAAEFSTQSSLYLAPKIASFASDMASYFGAISLPSLFILAELKTVNMYSGTPTEPLIPRRQDPFRQPRGSRLRSRVFYDDFLISDWMEVWYSSEDSERNGSGASVLAISKLKKAKLVMEDKEAGDCSVCLEEMSVIEELLTMPCDHIFHEQCILSWLENKNSCPLCRFQLQD